MCHWDRKFINSTTELNSTLSNSGVEFWNLDVEFWNSVYNNEPITELPTFVTRTQYAEGHQLFGDDFTFTFGHKPNTTMWIVESHKFDKRRKFHTWTFFEIGMEDKIQFV